MDTEQIVKLLVIERDRLNQAIAILDDAVPTQLLNGLLPPATKEVPARGSSAAVSLPVRQKVRKLSEAARRAISEAARRRWARVRREKAAAAKAKTAKKPAKTNNVPPPSREAGVSSAIG